MVSILGVGFSVLLSAPAPAQLPTPQLPTPQLLYDFDGAEGITFAGDGQLYIGANSGVWRVASPQAQPVRIADVHTHLGQAGIGGRDILAADFGPTNIFRDKAASANDGIVWRIAPDGTKGVFATGIADPNFILGLPDGSFLVSDDGVDRIYRVSPSGDTTVWSTSVPFPNGMVLSLDRSRVYVAQIFSALDPVVLDGRLWSIPVDASFAQAGPAELAVATDARGLDGLALDAEGRIYMADNGGGRILRWTPGSQQVEVVAEGMPHAASLVFGEGPFDAQSLYVTSTLKGGGRIWRVHVGTRGAPMFR